MAHQGSGLVRGVDVGDLAGRLIHSEVAGSDPQSDENPGDDKENDDNVKESTAGNVLLHSPCFPAAADDQR